MSNQNIKKQFDQLMSNSTQWSKDRWGNYKIVTAKGTYRLKPQERVLRLEVQGETTSNWFLSQSCYWKDLIIKDNKFSLDGRRFVLVFGE